MAEGEKVGIVQTKEALVALGAMAVVARLAWRDCGGDVAKFAPAFAVQLMANPAALAAVKAGYEDAKNIPAEFRDLDPFEGLELGEKALVVIRESFLGVQ